MYVCMYVYGMHSLSITGNINAEIRKQILGGAYNYN